MQRTVTRVSRTRQPAADLADWLAPPMAERIAAVEVLRRIPAHMQRTAMLGRDCREFAELLSARGIASFIRVL